ncbi:hypothetical protein PIB30_033568 [Stylosanthes scabra]|uniref:Uncharacterized protein n=1 Tax=Stylosanthes scabra TaxID=79078 RepID=A0ABU6WDS8_9FABA|nr:hypothetical protein [Stylosanthes scabra]
MEILHSPTFETSSSNGSKPVSFSPTDSHSQPRNFGCLKFCFTDISLSRTSIHLARLISSAYRNGKLPDLFTGIQAHLSTCASPKVLEVFPV